MNGDINLKINKKVGLLFIAVIGVYSMADFVTIIDKKDNGGFIVYEGISDRDKEMILSEVHPVGSVVFRMDTVNPSNIYGGTWELITGDASVSFGDGSVQSGNIIGDNEEVVVLPAHSHSRGTMEIEGGYGAHFGGKYYGPYADYDWSGAFKPYRARGTHMNYGVQYEGNGSTSGSGIRFKASEGWTGSTSIEGTNNPKMNIRDARIELNVWKRTN